MKDVALLSWYAFCVCKGCMFMFAAAAITTQEAWEAVRGIIG